MLEGFLTQIEGLLIQTTDRLGGFLPQLLGALGILIVGWIVALVARAGVRGALHRTQFDNRLAQWASGGKPVAIEQAVGTVVYWIVMLFVAVAVFQVLDLSLAAEPLNALLNRLAAFVPQLAGAAILLLIAWVVATALRKLLSGALHAMQIDKRLGHEEEGATQPMSLADSLGEAVYWLVFLLFLPAILGALTLEGMLQPVQSLVNEVLGFLPNLFGAGLILAVGWFVANLVRRTVTSLLSSVGADTLAERVGLGQALGAKRLSGFLGLIVYVLILLPVLTAALDALSLDAVTTPVSAMLNAILTIVPALLGVVVLLAIAYFIGRVVADLVTNVLAGAGFDNVLVRLGVAKAAPREGATPSAAVGVLVLVALMLFASVEAAGMLGFDALADLISRLLVLGGQVVLGLIIFGVGLFLANVAEATVRASATRQTELLALATRVSITVLAGAMGLQQMGLANEIITLAFGLLLGTVAVAAALAFGFGARDVAGRIVDEWTKSLKGK